MLRESSTEIPLANLRGSLDDYPNPNLTSSPALAAEILGKGAFCEVFAVSLSTKIKAVMKKPREDFKVDPKMLAMALRDLEREASLLASMAPFKHIVRMLGVHKDGEIVKHILLARVDEMFQTRYERWQSQREHFQCMSLQLASAFNASPLLSCFVSCSRGLRGAFAERLHAASELAQALDHLHTRALPGYHVAYRDLKPANIGFDERGRLILFDFGLAKLIPLCTSDYAKLRMSAETGSVRYMAPEVMVSSAKQYDHRCDTYSLGVLLWQICNLSVPFVNYNPTTYRDRVCIGGERLELDPTWPVALKNLVAACWAGDPERRPGCGAVAEILEELVDTLSQPAN